MNYTQLAVLIKSVLDAGLLNFTGYDGVQVVQNYQPTQQGVQDGPMVYFFNIAPNVRRGWVKRTDVWNPDTEVMQHSEEQWYESTFQCTCLFPQAAADTSENTAADLANAVASILQSDTTLTTFQAQNIGILRITDVKNPPFTDDREQYEYAATVDFTLTHAGVIVSETPTITDFDLEIKRV